MSLSRRTVLWAGAAVLVGAGSSSLGGCSTVPPTSAAPSGGAVTATSGAGRVLLASFSRAGENYWNGGRRRLSTGNTEVLAGLIRDRLGCDVVTIEAAQPYSEDYDPTVQRNVDEQNADARPRIAAPVPDLSGYDTVLLGSPIWNVQPPMIMATFVESVDLRGKTLHPFVTYAVSGLGRTASFYEGLDTGARLGEALAVRGEDVTTTGADDVERWLRRLRLS